MLFLYRPPTRSRSDFLQELLQSLLGIDRSIRFARKGRGGLAFHSRLSRQGKINLGDSPHA